MTPATRASLLFTAGTLILIAIPHLREDLQEIAVRPTLVDAEP